MEEQHTHEHTPERYYHHPVNPYHSSSKLLNALLCLCALALLALIVVGVFQAPGQFKQAGLILAWAFLGLAIVLTLAVIGYQAWNKWHLDAIKRQHAAADLKAKEQQRDLAKEEHEVRMYLAQSRLLPDERGNRPFVFNPRTYEITEVASGNYVQSVPTHMHQEISYADSKQLAAPSTPQPIALPSAPAFRDIAHLITPDRLILNYIESGPVYGQVDDLLSMALIGKPKRGKTTALLYYLCLLLTAGAEVWIWDPHGEMSELAYGLHYYDNLEEIAESSNLLLQELKDREMLYKQGKQVKHPLVLLVDEMPVIADWEREQQKMKRQVPSPYRVVKRFTLEARKWKGFVFISGQSLPANVLPTLTRDNLSSRLVLECSADHARMIGLPKETIDTLLPLLKGADKGTHIADFSSWSHPELADIPYTTIADLRAIIDDRVNDEEVFTDLFTDDEEPIHDIHQTFTRKPPNGLERRSPVVTGELVNNRVNEPVNGGEWHSQATENILDVSPEDTAKIIQLATMQQKMYGKVVRTKIRDAMGWNNKDFPKIKQVLDAEGL